MNNEQTFNNADSQQLNIGGVRRSYSKTYPKGTEITDDALIFIQDILQEMTIENENGYREFKAKVRITFNYA
jgi:hypothetical protein